MTWATSPASRRRSRARSAAAAERARSTTGPRPGTTSTPKPIAWTRHDDVGEQDRGVDPVAAHRLQGHLAGQLGVARSRRGSSPLPRSARYSGSERPAWRMNQTGTCATGSLRHAREERARAQRRGTRRHRKTLPGEPRGSGRRTGPVEWSVLGTGGGGCVAQEREVAEEQLYLDRAHARTRSDARRGALDARRRARHRARRDLPVAHRARHRRQHRAARASSSSTSATRRCASAASTRPRRGPDERRRVVPHRPRRRSPATTSSRSSSTGARRSPSPSTARRASSRSGSRGAATSTCGTARSSGVEDEYFTPADGTGPDRAQVERATQDGLVENGLALGGPGRPARRARPGEDRPDGRHRRDDPARAGRDHPRAAAGPPPRPGRARAPGKTAVALHRAAYLLYTHRFPLERQGVLVGRTEPAVPALHRAGPAVARRDRRHPVDGRGAGARDPGPRDRARRRRRAQGRRADGARRRARGPHARSAPLQRDVAIPFGVAMLTLSVSHDRGRRRPRAAASRRAQPAAPLRRARARRIARPPVPPARLRHRGDRGGRRPRRADPAGPEFRAALRRIWPRLAPHELIHDLLGALPLLRAAGKGRPPDARAAAPAPAAVRGRSTRCAWTSADAALVDEARTRPRARARAAPVAAPQRRSATCSTRRPPRSRPRRRADPQLRAHRRRRGPGPLGDAAAHARAALDLRRAQT